MIPIPIPDDLLAVEVAREPDTRRVVIGDPGDSTRDDLRPCEYLVQPSRLYPGRSMFSALLELDDDDRAAIAAGARLGLTLDGAEVPWAIAVQR